MGLGLPQFRHFVTANCIPQCGQVASDTNVSNGFWHRPQIQNSPAGGAALQTGQANS
jgi:hypothetical protein